MFVSLRRLPRLALLIVASIALVGMVQQTVVTADGEQEAGEPADPRYSKKLPLLDKSTKKDPIKENGPVYVDWPKPDATLVFTGAQDGYLEPCGCAGLTNQKGGLKRRHTLLIDLQEKGWNPVPLDTGGQIKRFGQQAKIKLRHTLEAMIDLKYCGVGFGTADLRMDMLGILINLDEDKNPMTSANIDFQFGGAMSRPYRVTEAGGVKIGFTSVLGKKEVAALGQRGDFKLSDPVAALQKVVPELQREGCDQLVLLVHGAAAEAKTLAQQFPQFQWVVAGLGADEPPHVPEKIEGTNAYLIEVGHKGMYAVSIGLYHEGDTKFRYQKVPIDHRYQDSPDMQQVLVKYQQELRIMTFKGLGLKATQHPKGGEFAGSEVCADCHTEAWEIFAKTPHSHALQTIEKLNPSRQYDPECVSCHVTGWNPQKYVPYHSGYVSREATPHLGDNGCENCHGPAAEHVAAENGDIDLTDAQIEALRQALHMELVENEGNMEGQVLGEVVKNCLECHDLDNSPEFDFQRYQPWVEHFGKD